MDDDWGYTVMTKRKPLLRQIIQVDHFRIESTMVTWGSPKFRHHHLESIRILV